MATADMMKPDHGQAGHVTIIHGDGLTNQNVVVTFGEANATDVDVLSDKIVKVGIPEKIGDSNSVTVEVKVNEKSIGQFPFEYKG